jgi:hypothetical protein
LGVARVGTLWVDSPSARWVCSARIGSGITVAVAVGAALRWTTDDGTRLAAWLGDKGMV